MKTIWNNYLSMDRFIFRIPIIILCFGCIVSFGENADIQEQKVEGLLKEKNYEDDAMAYETLNSENTEEFTDIRRTDMLDSVSQADEMEEMDVVEFGDPQETDEMSMQESRKLHPGLVTYLVYWPTSWFCGYMYVKFMNNHNYSWKAKLIVFILMGVAIWFIPMASGWLILGMMDDYIGISGIFRYIYRIGKRTWDNSKLKGYFKWQSTKPPKTIKLNQCTSTETIFAQESLSNFRGKKIFAYKYPNSNDPDPDNPQYHCLLPRLDYAQYWNGVSLIEGYARRHINPYSNVAWLDENVSGPVFWNFINFHETTLTRDRRILSDMTDVSIENWTEDHLYEFYENNIIKAIKEKDKWSFQKFFCMTKIAAAIFLFAEDFCKPLKHYDDYFEQKFVECIYNSKTEDMYYSLKNLMIDLPDDQCSEFYADSIFDTEIVNSNEFSDVLLRFKQVSIDQKDGFAKFIDKQKIEDLVAEMKLTCKDRENGKLNLDTIFAKYNSKKGKDEKDP